jgi:hypothetical protein
MFIRKSKVLLCAASMLVVGCSDHPGETWIAQERIPVYDGVEGKVIFYLRPMDSCEPGIDIAGKVDMYTKVKCGTGNGWVSGGNFKKLPRANH